MCDREEWLPEADEVSEANVALAEEDMKMARAMRKVGNYLGAKEWLAWNADTIADEVIARLEAAAKK